jgi:hypothetical protein
MAATRAVSALQDDAEMLLLIATSHYEPMREDFGCCSIARAPCRATRRVTIARQHAHAMGAHLRYAYENHDGQEHPGHARRQRRRLPWLRWSLLTLLGGVRSGGGPPGRHGSCARSSRKRWRMDWCPIPRAFVGADARAIAAGPETDRNHRAVRIVIGRRLSRRSRRIGPWNRAYSPLSLFFNFSQNLLKALSLMPW